jgi:hypothetical protein
VIERDWKSGYNSWRYQNRGYRYRILKHLVKGSSPFLVVYAHFRHVLPFVPRLPKFLSD